MVNFLAQVRKHGMDLVFPKLLHDKLLAALWFLGQGLWISREPTSPDLGSGTSTSTSSISTSTSSNAVPPVWLAFTHRELIDAVMLIKDHLLASSGNTAPCVGRRGAEDEAEWEAVTKTKVRGVLALLKHSGVLLTNKPAGVAVDEGSIADRVRDSGGGVSDRDFSAILLRLNPSCAGRFPEVRHLHDAYLLQFCVQHNVPISHAHWSDVVWSSNISARSTGASGNGQGHGHGHLEAVFASLGAWSTCPALLTRLRNCLPGPPPAAANVSMLSDHTDCLSMADLSCIIPPPLSARPDPGPVGPATASSSLSVSLSLLSPMNFDSGLDSGYSGSLTGSASGLQLGRELGSYLGLSTVGGSERDKSHAVPYQHQSEVFTAPQRVGSLTAAAVAVSHPLGEDCGHSLALDLSFLSPMASPVAGFPGLGSPN